MSLLGMFHFWSCWNIWQCFYCGLLTWLYFFSPAALTHLSPQTCVSRSLLVALPYAMFLLSSLAYCLLYLWAPVSFSAIFRFSHCLLAHYLNHLLVCPHVFSGIGVCRLSETGCLRNLASRLQCMISQFPSFQTLILQWIQSIMCSLAGICISTILCILQLMAIAHRNGINLRTQDHTSRFVFQTFQPCSRCGHNHHIYPREQAELVDDADQDELDDEASLVPTDLAGSDWVQACRLFATLWTFHCQVLFPMLQPVVCDCCVFERQ